METARLKAVKATLLTRKRTASAALIFLLFVVLIINNYRTANSNKPITKTTFGLNTLLTITAYGCEDGAVIDKAFSEIMRLERILSVNYIGSDIDRLYRFAGGDFIEVSSETYDILSQCLKFSTDSDGVFDATLGPLISLWDINGDTMRVPSNDEISAALKLADYNGIELRGGKYARLKKSDMKINLGAIAKGYIADKVRDLLVNEGVASAVINLGGNLSLIGGKIDGSPFNIAIKDPAGTDGKFLGNIKISGKSIVSSSLSERYFIKDGVRYHHIFDPATGYPSDSGLLQTTIISDKASNCDALSTITFILGAKKGIEFIEKLPDTEGIFVTQTNEVYLTSGIQNFSITNSEYKIVK